MIWVFNSFLNTKIENSNQHFFTNFITLSLKQNWNEDSFKNIQSSVKKLALNNA